jgi:hypothetical protein
MYNVILLMQYSIYLLFAKPLDFFFNTFERRAARGLEKIHSSLWRRPQSRGNNP